MRYEDASQAGSITDGAELVARPDVETLAPNSNGPGMGNAISGAGTNSGAAGADTVANGPGTIVELQGAGGAATPSGASLQAAGQYGSLTMSSDGSFSYVRNGGSPDGVQDVFQYTLADAAGARSSTTLTVEIPRIIDQQAVVNLPAGVEMSDIRVVGRDLVIQMPDGTQMVIPGGAVFVPELSIGDVVVPPSNLAALLIDSEPQPAAGPPQSSGGNFADDVPDLDPGVPLGDLLPPTELDYTPPEFEEPMDLVDREPTIIVITPNNPAGAINAVATVDESGLPERDGEPEGTLEPQNIETTTGTIQFTAEDGLESITINGTAITQVGQQIQGEHGILTITSIDLENGTIGYSYTATDNTTDGVDDFEDFTIVVTDDDGDTATGTLHIDILDDEPIARDDVDQVDLQANTATGNVMTGIGTNAGAASGDTVGADNATLTAVEGEGGSDSTFDADGNLVVDGEHGTLTIDAEGNYTYVPFDDAQGGTSDVFTYTLTDGDGDVITATLTIINPDTAPTAGANPVVQLDDDALAGGNPGGTGDDPNSVNATGTLSGSGGDGALTFDLLTTGAPEGFTYVDGPNGSILVQQVQDGVTVTVLTITVNPATGAYTVVQNANILHPDGQNENNVVFTINYTVTDADGDTVSSSLTVNVDDDTPLAANDTDSLGENGVATGNVITGAGTNQGTGNADKPGADGFAGITALVGAESSDSNPSGGFTVEGDFGSLVMDANGNYTYTRDPNSLEGGTDVFTYTYVDGDGDTVSATLTIVVPNIDLVPTLAAPPTVGLDDDALEGGNPGTPEVNDDPDSVNTNGQLEGSGGNGDLDYYFSGVTGLPAGQGFTTNQVNAGTLQILQNGTVVLTITLNNETGEYSVVQNAAIDHPEGNLENNLTFTIGVYAQDEDGSQSPPVNITINVDDDTPEVNEQGSITGVVDEDDLPDGNDDDAPGDDDPTNALDGTVVSGADGSLDALFKPGADQPLTYSLNSDTQSLEDQALTSNGQPLSYVVVDGVVYAFTGDGDLNGDGIPTTGLVFTLAVDADGSWTFTLLDQLDHEPPAEGDPAFENNLDIDFSGMITATDADGDPAPALGEGAFVITVDDDSPQPFVDCPEDAVVTNEPGSDLDNPLNLPPVGADEPGNLAFDIDFTDPVPVVDKNGDPVFFNGQPLYYSLKEGDPTVLEARTGEGPGEGELVFYFDLDQDAGTYDFVLVQPVDNGAGVTFSDLEGVDAGNTDYAGLGADDAAMPVDVLISGSKKDGSDGTINTSQQGIGVGNQATNDGETVRLDFVSNLTTGGAGPSGFDYGGHVGTNSFIQLVSQVTGNPTEVSFNVFALNTAATSADELDRDPDDGFSDLSLVQITSITVIGGGVGETEVTLDLTGKPIGVEIPVAYGISVIVNADGSVTFTGVEADDSYGIGTGNNDFNAVAIQNVEGNFDLNEFSIGSIDTGDPVDLSVPIVLTDADGDPVVCDIDVTINPAVNTVPTVSIPAANLPQTLVDEEGLPARAEEPEGSEEPTDAETTSGTITYTDGDAPATVTIDGFNNGDPVEITGPYPIDIVGEYGTLTITAHDTTTNTISYTYTLTDNVDHDTDLSPTDTFPVRVTDADGQQANGNLVITIADDGPVAADDFETQSPEGADVIVDVFANDLAGADDVVLSDATKVFAVEGSLTGTGTLTYNNDGTFTYVPDAGEVGPVEFDYTIIDNDGTESTAHVTITLDDDSVPQIGQAPTLTVDEDGLAGIANADEGQTDPDEDAHGENATDSDTVTVDFGEDVPADVDAAFEFINPSALDNQLTQGGQPITFSIVGGNLVGQVNGEGPAVITISMTGAVDNLDGTVDYTYDVTLAGPVDQAGPGGDQDEDGITLTGVEFQVTDGDNTTASSSFNVIIYDDVPSATDEAEQNVGEGDTATGTFDFVEGADGASVTHVNGEELVFDEVTDWSQEIDLGNGASIIVKANGDYEFTAGDPTDGTPSITGTFTVTDGDGDEVEAGFEFDVTDEYGPTASSPTAWVDDDGLEDGNPDSTDGDHADDDLDGDNNETTYSGNLVTSFGDDDAGSVNFADMDADSEAIGQETVTYSWNALTNTLTATITASPDDSRENTTLFTVVVTPGTGEYTVTLEQNVLHTPSGDDTEGQVSVTLDYNVLDSDGTTATGVLTLNFDDDMPSDFTPVEAIVENTGTDIVTDFLDLDEDMDDNIGADRPASIAFDIPDNPNGTPLLNTGGGAITVGGDAVLLFLEDDGSITATTDRSDPDATVFTATLDLDASTYTIDFDRPLDNGSTTASDLSAVDAGNTPWAGFDPDVDNNGDPIGITQAPDPNPDSTDLLFTGYKADGTLSTVNNDSDDIGVGTGQKLDAGEALRVDMVQDLRYDPTKDESDAGGYLYDTHVGQKVFSFGLIQTQSHNEVDVLIKAFNVNDANATSQSNVNDAGVNTQIDIDPASIVVKDSGGNVLVEGVHYNVYESGLGVYVQGLPEGATVTFQATGGATFEAVTIENANGDQIPGEPAGTKFTGAEFALGNFSYGENDPGDPVEFELPVVLTDSDGDTSEGTIPVTVYPEGEVPAETTATTALMMQESLADTSDMTAAALVASNDNIEQARTFNVANQAALMGVIAAAGLNASAQMAIKDASSGLDHAALGRHAQGEVSASSDVAAVSGLDLQSSTSSLLASTEQGSVEASGRSSAKQTQETSSQLDTAAGESGSEALSALHQGTDAPALEATHAAMTAQAVAMPSAEMVAALDAAASALDAPAGASVAKTHEVGRVLADALQGGDGPDIGALLGAATGDGGKAAALEALASHHGGGVPDGYSGHMAGFANGHGVLLMDPQAFHHDAPPASV